MKLADFVVRDAIIADLETADRDGVIRELTNSLAQAIGLDDASVDEVVKALIERERHGSTGFGKGVAVPHAKHAAVTTTVSTIGRSATGIDFGSLDKAPVYSVILLLSPLDSPDMHLQAMETIFRHLQRDTFRRFLRQSETVEAIIELVEEADDLP